MNKENEVVIDKDTWGRLSAESQGWIIYNTVKSQGDRIGRLERKGVIHKALAVTGGFIGGIVSVVGTKLFS